MLMMTEKVNDLDGFAVIPFNILYNERTSCCSGISLLGIFSLLIVIRQNLERNEMDYTAFTISSLLNKVKFIRNSFTMLLINATTLLI